MDLARWNYKSLEWIHETREKNYEKTKEKDLKSIIEDSARISLELIVIFI